MNVMERFGALFGGGGARRRGRRERGERGVPERPLNVVFELDSLEACERTRALLGLLGHLDRERFHFTLACVEREGALAPRARALGAGVRSLDGDPARYRALLGEGPTDLVAAIGSGFGLPLTAEAGVAHLQLFDSGARVLAEESKAMRREVREVERVVAVSPAVGDRVRRRLKVRGERLQFVPPGVDVAGLAGRCAGPREEARRELGFGDEALVFLCLGDFEPATGHAHAIRAFGRLSERHPEAALVCAGDPVDPAHLERCRALADGARVRISPLEPEADPARLYAAADFFVQPVGVDGLRQATLEAFACGRPLVVAGGADVGEMVGEPPAAVLFRERVDWSKRRRKALANLRDPADEALTPLFNALGRACREAPQLKDAAIANGRDAVEAGYGIEAVARCWEGVLLAAWSA